MSVRRDVILWISILAGPTAWLISFEANFALVPWTCIWQDKVALYLVSLATFAASAVSGFLAWRELRTRIAQTPGEQDNVLSRVQVMAIGGVSLSAFSCLVIVAQAVPELFLGACQ